MAAAFGFMLPPLATIDARDSPGSPAGGTGLTCVIERGFHMYSTIVVGTDGSDTADVAIERAGALAALCGASVHLVHGCAANVAFADPSMGTAILIPQETIEQLENRLEEQAEKLRDQGVDATVHVVTKSGGEALLSFAESLDADLIVVGNRGMTGKKRFFLGSVPNAVSHHAPCSVLIVHTT